MQLFVVLVLLSLMIMCQYVQSLAFAAFSDDYVSVCAIRHVSCLRRLK